VTASCDHLGAVATKTANASGCEEGLATDTWVHLRLCRSCGYVGCCDSPENRRATRHFHATGHPILTSI